MRYEFQITKHPRYLHVKVKGQNNPDTVRQYLRDVKKACEEHSCAAVLIEEDLQGPSLEIVDIFQIASEGSAAALDLIVAFVDVNKEHDFSRVQFAETVAVNRCVRVRVFRSVGSAAQWLLAQTLEPKKA